MTGSTRLLLIYLSSCAAALGAVGGYQIIRRKYIEQKVADLFNPPQLSLDSKAVERHLRLIRGTLNDTHKRVLTISKGLNITPR